MADRRQILHGLVAALLLSWPVAILLAQVLPIPPKMHVTFAPTSQPAPKGMRVEQPLNLPDRRIIRTPTLEVTVWHGRVLVQDPMTRQFVDLAWDPALCAFAMSSGDGRLIQPYVDFLLAQEHGYPVNVKSLAEAMVGQ